MTGRATHGHTRGRKTTPEFRTWCAMLQRCYYEKGEKYKSYGARGITVCDSWKNSFEQFLTDMGPRPDGCTLDRVDGNGNYEPSNCRWATIKEQNENRDRKNLGWKRRNTHCPQGHPYSGSNLSILAGGARRCKTCDRERSQKRRDTMKLERQQHDNQR